MSARKKLNMMTPFEWSSRKDTSDLQEQKADQCYPGAQQKGDGLMTKDYEATFGDDGNDLCLYSGGGGGYTIVYICQNSSTGCILLY